MPADTIQIAAPIISWIATYLLHSTCLLGGVWLLLRLRPGTGPSAREILWKMALIGGLISTPALLLWNPSSQPGALTLNFSDRSQVNSRTGAADESREATDAGFRSRGDKSGVEHVDTLEFRDERTLDAFVAESEWDGSRDDVLPGIPVNAREPAASGAEISIRVDLVPGRRPHESNFGLLLALSIVTGSFAWGLGRHFRQAISLRRKLAGAKPFEPGLARHLLSELCEAFSRPRRVRLLAAPCCTEPMAFGLRRWTIVLPERAERDLSADELRSLLAHELAHLVRGDTWWLLVSRLICLCAGFQPLNHLARREWQRAAEYLCDAWAVNRTGNRLALARCLTEVAGWRLSRSECAASLAATGSRSVLADRIERLVDDRSSAALAVWMPARRRLIGAGLVVLGSLIASGLRVNLSVASGETAYETEISSSAIDRRLAPERELILTGSTTPSTVLASAPVDPPASSTDGSQQMSFSIETRILWNALDRELRGLQRDLTELQPLLGQPAAPPEARRLAERLGEELRRLEERREAIERAAVGDAMGERDGEWKRQKE